MWASPLRALLTLGVLVIVAGMAVLMILPFYWMLVTALSPAPDVMAFPPKWVPSRVTLAHFQYALQKAPWALYYGNSLVVAVISVGCSLVFGLFAGYAFAVYRFPLQNVLFLLILSTLMVPVQVTSVALYILLSRISWVDTYAGILAPNFASAFGVFLLRQAVRQIPGELIEAARIDGAGEWRTFFTISARLLGPGVVTVLLFTTVATWNNYFLPLVMLSNPNWYPVTVGLGQWNAQAFSAGDQVIFNLVITGSLLAIIPIMIAFLIMQRYWRSGLAAGSVKQ